MIKKTITYTDYMDKERTEEFYFNLSKAEQLEAEMSVSGGLTAMLRRMMNRDDVPGMVKTFKDFILMAYGEKSPDGREFVKVDANGRRLADSFSQTAAYDKLFMELATDATAAAEFCNGVIGVTNTQPAIKQE